MNAPARQVTPATALPPAAAAPASFADMIEAALPDHDSGFELSAREIFAPVRFNSIGTVRLLLRDLIAKDRAVKRIAQDRYDRTLNLYRKAKAMPHNVSNPRAGTNSTATPEAACRLP